jgi:hypothetical protein
MPRNSTTKTSPYTVRIFKVRGNSCISSLHF